jgi:pyruvyltransferase
MYDNCIPAFWYSSNNFGDALTHYLIKKISGKMPVLVERGDAIEKVMVTGSILNNEVDNSTVWGCGVAWSNDKIHQHKKINAVRGLLTGKLCKKQGIVFDEVYGDPALLLPRYYNPIIEKKYKIGIMPHYVDTLTVFNKIGFSKSQLESMGYLIVDVLDNVESVINQILSCEKIICSTLHGIIAAHAYGIPVSWVKFTDKIGGDDFKYFDYFSTTKTPSVNFVDYRNEFNLYTIKNLETYKMPTTETIVDLDVLYNACPFKP